MASTPSVTFEDVNDRYLEGNLEDLFDRDKVETQIEDAVDYASTRWGSVIELRISGGQLSGNLYRRTVANAVLRVLRNPEGYANESDGGYAYGLRPDVASGNLWFTGDDIETLRGVVQTVGPGTISMGLDRGWA
jgi:hypothetical protein